MKIVNRLWPYFLAIIFSLILLRPILGNVWYPMHDTTHIARIFLMEQAIGRGEFPPLWAEGINQGLGYPLFHFYAPLFYYLALFFSYFTGHIAAIKVTLVISLAIGITGVIKLAGKIGKDSMLLAGMLFATSPYLAVNIFVRGAYAELLALCLFPWVLYAWKDLLTTKKQIMASVAVTLFFVSHNLLPLISFPIIAIWALVSNRHQITRIFLPTIMFVLLSSFFLIPLLFERNFVQADAIAKTSDYQLHFIEPWQVWNSSWGYGGSTQGVEDGFSFKLGKLHLLVALIGSLILIIKKRYQELILAIGVIYFIFMSTSFSYPLWESVPILQLTQFPWRHLSLTLSLTAILGSFALSAVKSKITRIPIVIVVSVLLIILNLKYFAPQSTFIADESKYTNSSYLETVANIIPEYKPRWQKSNLLLNDELFTNLEKGVTQINRAYYPTWQVKLDGKIVETFPTSDGMLAINNPQMSTNIEFTQVHTQLQYLGYSLTIMALIIAIIMYLKK